MGSAGKAPGGEDTDEGDHGSDAEGAVDDPYAGVSVEAAAAPRLLDSIEERRKRELIRARLFGESPEPLRIGRFVPMRRLGAGGMGVVYVAYDEQLERKVAVKLLRSEGQAASDRLLREAQALARVAHPNIVSIYEVGVADGRVFIAMELVAGKTLREWLTEQPRTRAEILGAFEQAGRGLVAVHQQGLIHRDFKPDNVMMGDDGRVRIVDFGLARLADSDAESRSRAASPLSASGEALPTVGGRHATGGVAGTPLYMSPEQHAGGAISARSDQYSFCVALFEALYGEGPFAASNLIELADKKAAGEISEVKDRLGVPEWLLEIIRRGLHPNPDERWPSMAALLAEAVRDRWKWPRRALVLVGGLALAASSMGLGRWLQSSDSSACTSGRSRIAEIWNAGQRSAVQKSLLGSGKAYAAETLTRVEAELDRYASGWAAMHGEACIAHRRGEQSAELLDLRMACLERQRGALRATVQVLEEGAPVEHAFDVASGLPSLASCADAVGLRRAVKPPSDPVTAKQVVELRERIVKAEAEERAGRYERGLSEAAQVEKAAEATQYAPVIAEALFVRASLESRLGRYLEAASTLEATYVRALASRQDELAGQATNLLLYVVGYRQARFEAVRPWEYAAEALVLRLPEAGRLAVDFYGNRGLIRIQQGLLPQASADTQRALVLAEQVFGAHHLKFARVLNNASQIELSRRDYAATLRYQQQALAIREEILGPEHPVVGASLSSVGSTLKSLGRFSEAASSLQRALSISERAAGAEHPDTAVIRRHTAEVLIRQGKYQEARVHLERASKSLSGEQPGIRLRLAAVLATFAELFEREHNDPASVTYASNAVAIQSEHLPPEHLELGNGLAALGEALLRVGRFQQAEEPCENALSIITKKVGSGHPLLVAPLVCLARIALEEKNRAVALSRLEQAVGILGKEPPSLDGAAAHFLLAQTLSAGSPSPSLDRVRILAFAERAIKDYEAAGPAYRPDAERVRELVAKQR